MSHPGTDQAERLRRRLWYFNVKVRSGMSDYELSKIFDLNINAVSKRLGGKARRRLFERLRKFDEMPFRGHIAEFVRLVDQHPATPSLSGTESLYFSPFWEIIGKKPLDLSSLRRLIIKCARTTNLLNEAGQLNDQIELMKVVTELPPQEMFMFLRSSVDHYEMALEAILPKCELSLDSLALLGGLYREAYYAGHLHIALLLDGYFGNYLQNVMDCDWVPKEIKDELFHLTVQRVLTVSFPTKDIKAGYLTDLSETENAGSPLGMLLARHDRILWGIIEDDPFPVGEH